MTKRKVSLLCAFTCFCNREFWEKADIHILKENSFSPVCIRMSHHPKCNENRVESKYPKLDKPKKKKKKKFKRRKEKEKRTFFTQNLKFGRSKNPFFFHWVKKKKS